MATVGGRYQRVASSNSRPSSPAARPAMLRAAMTATGTTAWAAHDPMVPNVSLTRPSGSADGADSTSASAMKLPGYASGGASASTSTAASELKLAATIGSGYQRPIPSIE